MYDYIEGKIIEINPAYAVLECSGIGYFVNISITTYTQIQSYKEIKLHMHMVIREDAHMLYGFFSKFEREIFRYLISVSGIGANTARMMLSSLSPDEIQRAIVSENVNLLKSIKGIGAKSAQRVIVDLKDKIGKEAAGEEIFALKDNTMKEEALSALVMLGFSKSAVEKVLNKLLIEDQNVTVEDLIKKALKKL